jgi:hypothetical protein
MGWRELRHWLREFNRARKAEAGQGTTDPDSWAGAENDRWWAEQRELQARMRGR